MGLDRAKKFACYGYVQPVIEQGSDGQDPGKGTTTCWDGPATNLQSSHVSRPRTPFNSQGDLMAGAMGEQGGGGPLGGRPRRCKEGLSMQSVFPVLD
jgi:hypothetical protein